MKIVNLVSDSELDEILISLTEQEALELRDAINTLLSVKDSKQHIHVSNFDYSREITVFVEH